MDGSQIQPGHTPERQPVRRELAGVNHRGRTRNARDGLIEAPVGAFELCERLAQPLTRAPTPREERYPLQAQETILPPRDGRVIEPCATEGLPHD